MSALGTARRYVRTLVSGSLLLLALSPPLPAQDATEDVTALRDKAFQLWQQGNQKAALPLLEKLAVMRPDDIVVLERLGGALAGAARQISDPGARKKAMLRARSLFLRAKELGDKSDYLNVMLDLLPEDGELTAFSADKAVDEAMREGEAAFGKGDFSAALKSYQRALALDPRNYAAALFSGDVYFNLNQMNKASEWFSRAIQIDPNRETAYRYWADGLMKEGKMDEARGKYIEAVVAEPYAKAPWVNLKKWADHNNATLAHPKIEPPGSVSGDGKEIKITIPPDSLGKKGEGGHWLMYSMSRALWRGEKFKKEFPKEKTYRLSLREEVEALEGVITVASEIAESRKTKNQDPQVQTLAALKENGLLEAFVLISRADEGIAQDYAAYRAQHRDKLAQYISDWIISTAPAK